MILIDLIHKKNMLKEKGTFIYGKRLGGLKPPPPPPPQPPRHRHPCNLPVTESNLFCYFNALSPSPPTSTILMGINVAHLMVFNLVACLSSVIYVSDVSDNGSHSSESINSAMKMSADKINIRPRDYEKAQEPTIWLSRVGVRFFKYFKKYSTGIPLVVPIGMFG